ncbi:carbohydrate binding domain-containing protein [Microbacterium ulmi]|uniref:mannan endo-1,4-beta-mannosidase n=1 Tax=Microbacterium ulmi TaxID=179095 RepID=A0A7Y2Q000_9MICO|nr:carbohydrate binding domain-containing protein [Microbacterium ulmi]NII69913.1 hypothetical protein [Microbacterium ulmi]NNH03833.1 cellulase family glycosylhydrolase [Microbacterium ulmi]
MRNSRHIRMLAALAAAGVVTALLTAAPATAAVPPPASSQAPTAPWSSMNTDFVARDAARLTLGGAPFRFNGANLYWLGLDENVGGVAYPTFFRIKDALDAARELGLTVVRSHMMTSTSQNGANPLAIMPTLGEYNDAAFATVDFAIAYAGSIGIRLVLPLTDEWSYYHGGHRDFTAPLGLQPTDFYSDPTAIAAYQDYVGHILARTNALTGIPYVDDPTVLAWELGNELENMTTGWIADQVDFIKARAPHQLVAAGRRFDIDADTLAVPGLDIVDMHYYPPTAEKVAADAKTVVDAGKVYIAGEYGSNSASSALFDPLAANSDVTGLMLWSLFPHNDRGGFVAHDDGFTTHYPGTTDKMRAQTAAVKAYSEKLGAHAGAIALDAPLITEVSNRSGIKSVAWRGSAGATAYRIERSSGSGGWTVVAEVPAEASPVLDPGSAGDVVYRVVAVAPGKADATSAEVPVAAAAGVVVDPLESLSIATAAHDVGIAASPAGGRAVATGDAASITWTAPGARSARFLLGAGSAADVTIASSEDGSSWTDAATTVSGGEIRADRLSGGLVRVSWKRDAGIELVRATLTSVPPKAALVDPLDNLSLTSSHTGALSIDTGNVGLFAGDAGRLKRDSADPASVTWSVDDVTGVDLVAWYWPDRPVIPLVIRGSADGTTWTDLAPVITGGAGNWKRFDYSLRGLSGLNHIQVSWDGAKGEPWTPQIGGATLYSSAEGAVAAPGSFGLLSPADGATEVNGSPRLTWTSAPDAAYYRVVVATDASFTKVVEESAAVTGTGYTISARLTPGTTYHWRVTAVNGAGQTVATPASASFRTTPLPTQVQTIDDFEGYADAAALAAAYPRNTGGGTVQASLTSNPTTGSKAAEFAYDLTGPGYAGIIRTFAEPRNWWGYRGIQFDAKAASGEKIAVQFVAAGSYWEADVDAVDGWHHYEIDFDRFAPPSWAGSAELDLTRVSQHAFYRNGTGTGTLTIDDIRTTLPVTTPPAPTAPVNVAAPSVTGDIRVGGTLRANPGTWQGEPKLTFQWKRGGADIAGATKAEYVVKAADEGAALTVVVTAVNAGGTTSVTAPAVTVPYRTELRLDLSTPLGLSITKVKATVELKTAADVRGRSVTVTVAGQTATVVLDAKGKGTVILPKLRTGIYGVRAEFAGAASIAAATSPSRLLIILF